MPKLILPFKGAEQQGGVGLGVQRFKLGVAARHYRPRRARRDGKICNRGTKWAGGLVILFHALTLRPSAVSAKTRMSYDITQTGAQKSPVFATNACEADAIRNHQATHVTHPKGHIMFTKLRRIYAKETSFDWTVFAANVVGVAIVALAFAHARDFGAQTVVEVAQAGF